MMDQTRGLHPQNGGRDRTVPGRAGHFGRRGALTIIRKKPRLCSGCCAGGGGHNGTVPIHRYFCESIRLGPCRLSVEESRHAAVVMRTRAGDVVELFDGRGAVFEATVTRVEREGVALDVTRLQAQVPRSGPWLALFVAVPKGPRQRFLVEKCTELGVSGLCPIKTERCVVKPADSLAARWRRYAVEACKQSRQAWLPVVERPMEFAESMHAEPFGAADDPRGGEARRLIASIGQNQTPPLKSVLQAAGPSVADAGIALWIGPEGGFTEGEVQAAQACGVQPVSLGGSVLRIETAAVAATAAVRLGCP